MHPSRPSASTSEPSAQDLASKHWNHITNERAALVKERDDLKAENRTLRQTVQSLQKQIAESKPAPSLSRKGRKLASAQRKLELTQLSLQGSLAKPNAEGVPDEVLLEVFGHLHDVYNRAHRENALRGVIDPSPESRPWNPARLQLVCRRWRGLARPLFYRDQVAIDCRKPFALAKLTRTLANAASVPFPRLLVLSSSGTLKMGELLAVDSANKAHTPVKFIASTPDWDSFKNGVLASSSCLIAPRDDRAPGGLVRALHSTFLLIRSVLENALDGGNHTVRDIGLRFSRSRNVQPVLAHILGDVEMIVFLPHLRFEFPFTLPAALLDPAAPELAGILKHPSHEVGRAFLLSRDNTIKRISFGTHSETDAAALRARIESLGELDVVVQVDVLDI